MVFWKRKEKGSEASAQLPDTDSQYDETRSHTESLPSYRSSPPASYRSSPPTSYSSRPPRQQRTDSGSREENRNREALFSGRDPEKYNQTQHSPSRFQDDDEEVGNMKQQIDDIKKESLTATQEALRKIYETEESGANSLQMLGQQSRQLANVNRNLDVAKAQSKQAADQTADLERVNGSIFNPLNYYSNKSAKKKLAEAKVEHAEHMEQRNAIRQFERGTQNRIQASERQRERSTNTGRTTGRRDAANRSRYQFEADEEDDQVEDEIEGNLDLLGEATSRLNNLARTMNKELDSQNIQVDGLAKKVDPINERLRSTTAQLNRV